MRRKLRISFLLLLPTRHINARGATFNQLNDHSTKTLEEKGLAISRNRDLVQSSLAFVEFRTRDVGSSRVRELRLPLRCYSGGPKDPSSSFFCESMANLHLRKRATSGLEGGSKIGPSVMSKV